MTDSIDTSYAFRSNEVVSENLCYVFLVIGIVIRVCFFFFATNNGGDALARAAITAGWLQHPSFALEFAGPHWLPIHFWMMAGLSALLHNVTLGSRLVSLLFGIFSVWAVWRLTCDLFGVQAALLSLAMFDFYTLQLGYSTTSSSEATYLGLLLAAFLCLFSYRAVGDIRFLASAGLLLTIDAGIRYEAWVFILVIALLLAFKPSEGSLFAKGHLTAIVTFSCTAGLWPIFWMIVQWKLNGDPLFGLHHNEESIAGQLAMNPVNAGRFHQLLLTPGVLLLTLTLLALVGAAYAVFLALRELAARELAIIAVAFALVQFRTLATGGLLAGARYTLTDGVLICLLAGYGLYHLARKFSIHSYKAVLYGTTSIMAANLIVITTLSAAPNRYTDKFRSISPLLQYPEHIEQIAQFLRPRLKPSDAVVIDNYNEEPNIIAAAIGLPLLRGNRAFLASEADPPQVSRYILLHQPKYLIMANQGTLGKYLGLSGGSSETESGGYKLTRLFGNVRYTVYSVSHVPAATAFPLLLSDR